MGGGSWDEAVQIARQYPQVLFDTAIAVSHVDTGPQTWLDDARAVELMRAISAERVLFGSDYPWIDPKGDIERIRRLPLTGEEKRQVLGENAGRALGLVSQRLPNDPSDAPSR